MNPTSGSSFFFFFFNDTATTEIYTLSLHDALPIRSRQPQLLRHWSTDGPRVQVQYATDRPGLPESGITVPVVFGEQVVGVLAIQSYEPEAYDEDDLALVQSIADQ